MHPHLSSLLLPPILFHLSTSGFRSRAWPLNLHTYQIILFCNCNSSYATFCSFFAKLSYCGLVPPFISMSEIPWSFGSALKILTKIKGFLLAHKRSYVLSEYVLSDHCKSAESVDCIHWLISTYSWEMRVLQKL